MTAWPEIIEMDGTYKLTNCNLTLMLIVVEDSNRQSEIVAACLLVQEDRESLKWFLDTFNSENEVACAKIITVMTDKDLLERDIIRDVWSHVLLRICSWHAEKIFERAILKLCEGTDKSEKENLKDLLKKLIYTESSEHYDKLYSHLQEVAPSSLLKYYEENWSSIKEEWCKFTAPPRSFGNNTNNRVECFNKHLKDIIKKNRSLHQMVEGYFTFQESHQQEVDGKAASINKKKNWNVAENDSLRKYDDFLTNGAFDYVEEEIKKSEYINLEETEPGKFIVKAINATSEPTLHSCTCTFWFSIGLPCCHIFSLRKHLSVDFFDPALCLHRWTREYYKLHQRVLKPRTEDDNKNALQRQLECVQVTERVSLPEKVQIVGRPSKIFDTTVKIPRKQKTYQDKNHEEKAKLVFSWFNLPKENFPHILKGEMLINKNNLEKFSQDTFPQPFGDEKVDMEEIKPYFETEAFNFLKEEIQKLRLVMTYKCNLCTNDISDTRFVKCTSCLLCFHLFCYGYKRAPTKNKNWFCKTCK